MQLASEDGLGRVSESRAAPLGLCFIFLPLSCRLASTVAPVRAFQATSFVPKGTRGFSYHMEPEPWVLGSKPWGNSRAPSLAAEYVLTWATPVQTLPEQTAGSCLGSGCEQGLAERSREHRKIPKALSCRVLVIDSHILPFRKRKGDEVDGMDQVAKKKSKKEKDKDSKLEKALKVSSELCVSFRHCLSSLSSFWKKVQGGEQDFQEFPDRQLLFNSMVFFPRWFSFPLPQKNFLFKGELTLGSRRRASSQAQAGTEPSVPHQPHAEVAESSFSRRTRHCILGP